MNFAICRASFAKSKRTRAPARFPVLKGSIRRQTVRAKQAGHFPLFNCMPHTQDSLKTLRNVRESKRDRYVSKQPNRKKH